jgi:hypothetical protein
MHNGEKLPSIISDPGMHALLADEVTAYIAGSLC